MASYRARYFFSQTLTDSQSIYSALMEGCIHGKGPMSCPVSSTAPCPLPVSLPASVSSPGQKQGPAPWRPQGAGSSSLCGSHSHGSIPQCRLVLSSAPQPDSSRKCCCMESGRETRLSQGKGTPIWVPCTPPPQRPRPSDPLQPHLSWICCSRCCWATISRLCCCTWPVSTHMMWLCLSAWACGVRTETSAGADSPPVPWPCSGLATPRLHLCALIRHCCSVASTSPSVKWG